MSARQTRIVDTRRKPNGMLYLLVASAALAHPVSREWKGYWQRGQ